MSHQNFLKASLGGGIPIPLLHQHPDCKRKCLLEEKHIKTSNAWGGPFTSVVWNNYIIIGTTFFLGHSLDRSRRSGDRPPSDDRACHVHRDGRLGAEIHDGDRGQDIQQQHPWGD